ncbi:hypothetical protein NUBL17187_05890 [Klebsiella michiganensis]|nr:hypothetical protein NUBL17187_05890 [Klebsiella michiganensis]
MQAFAAQAAFILTGFLAKQRLLPAGFYYICVDLLLAQKQPSVFRKGGGNPARIARGGKLVIPKTFPKRFYY